ncbi:putative Dispanin subfamily A member 2b protein [Naja naja]|nr:putative Dispanin subfamily A member 2b protein [Naja naja]
MEPYPTEAVMRPTSPYQYPKATSSPVRDYVVWSLFSFTTCNCCCLGLFALFYSIKVNGAGKDMGRALSSRDRKVLGDPEGAANHGRTAKYLNIAAVTITIIVYIIFIIILISSALFIVNIIFEIMRLPDEIEELRRN